jgi:excisionase family DNA binding protein
MSKTILVADEVADLLRVDKQRIYELVRTNQIPVIRLGERQYRFSAQAIEDFLHGGGTLKEGVRNDSN